MSEQTKVSYLVERLLSKNTEGFDSLAELTLNTATRWHNDDP